MLGDVLPSLPPLCFGLLIIGSSCLAQLSSRLSIGVLGGGVATGSLGEQVYQISESNRYTLGPFAEWRLTESLRLHTGVTYQRIGERQGGCFLTYCSVSGSRAHAVQAPVLIRWRLVHSATVPFVTGGYSYRRVTSRTSQTDSWRSGPLVSNEVVDYTVRHSTYHWPGENTHGLVAGGGLELPAGRFKMAPEFRYTRWNRRYWEFHGSQGIFTGSNLNQVDVLFGVRF